MSRLTSILLLAVVHLGWIGLLESKAADQPKSETTFSVYPDSSTSFNPRVPCIAPVDRPDGGKDMEVEAVFQYALTPFVRFPQGGSLHAEVRDNGRREAKEIVVLADDHTRLLLRVSSAMKGGMPALVLMKDGKEVASAPFAKPLPQTWTGIDFKWNNAEVSLTLQTGESVKLALSGAFSPQNVSLQTAQVAGLKIAGQGTLTLNWENGYAARVEPSPESQSVEARFFGFDTYVISQDKTKRDCPTVQLLNGSSAARTVKFVYDLTGEQTQGHQQWSQEINVPAKSEMMVPLVFPTPLASDVYHLAIRSDSLQPAYSATRHFLFVESRDEAEGPAKFGLHDSARNLFGAWPDVLPVRLSTNYVSWGVVVGPAWVKDPGMTAETPAEQWNWNRRVDWAVGQGLTPYVCIGSMPFYDWARARDYPPDKMKKQPWGTMGGFPRLDLYRQFVKTLALRYKGKVRLYEVDNEPMAGAGITPEDYVQIAQAASEEIHAVDPGATVYGICGTGDFVPWMRKVFDLGGAKVMDGVSIHTYVTPNMPDNANLPGKLAEVDAIMAGAGRPMPLLNSETGTFVALREEVDHPISPARLAELIKAGAPNLSVKAGWPFRSIDERQGGTSVVRNAIYNFLAKAQYFTFFGYNPAWPPSGWANGASLFSGEHGVDDACWAMISCTKTGERTPSLFTLSIGVLTEQMRGARQLEGKPVDDGGIKGGIFPKANGGEVAVLWSPLGKRSALVQAADADIETVSMLGEKKTLTSASATGGGLFRLELGEEPVYVHAKHQGLRLLPSPVIALAQEDAGTQSGFRFTLVNTYTQPWQGNLQLSAPSGWKVTLDSTSFSLDPAKRVVIKGTCDIPPSTVKGSYTVAASLKLPDGTPFEFPITIDVRPSLTIPSVGSTFAWNQQTSWTSVQPALKIDQTEQVAAGRPPALASLQEEKYWKGPAELSAEVRLASDSEALLVYVEVQDANLRVPTIWPSVLGSCVELFLDARSPGSGLGNSAYAPGVHQLVLKPALNPSEVPLIWDASEKIGKLEGVTTVGGRLAPDKYWLALQIPWKSLGQSRMPDQALGFDLGINGPPKDGAGRKSQLMLFGNGLNNMDASGFGRLRIRTDVAEGSVTK